VPIHDIQDYANNMITNNVKKGNSYTLSTINYSEELVSELKSHNETLKNQNQHLNKIIIEKDEQITLLKSLLEK